MAQADEKMEQRVGAHKASRVNTNFVCIQSYLLKLLFSPVFAARESENKRDDAAANEFETLLEAGGYECAVGGGG